MAVVERDVEIVNPQGVHARPAAEFVKIAGAYQSDVLVSKDGYAVNGKSIMGVMTLAAECGSTIHLRAEGDDAKDVIDALAALVARGFGEL